MQSVIYTKISIERKKRNSYGMRMNKADDTHKSVISIQQDFHSVTSTIIHVP